MGTYVFKWPTTADEVYVTGTFDNWSKSVQLDKVGDSFAKKVELSDVSSKIYYKFVVDGSWVADNAAPKETDASGNDNNVLTPAEITKFPTTLSSAAPTSSTAELARDMPLTNSGSSSPISKLTAPVAGAAAGIAAAGAASFAAIRKGASKDGKMSDAPHVPGAFPGSEPAETTSGTAAATSNLNTESKLINPLPAAPGGVNPIKLAPGEKIPDSLRNADINENVKLDPESYEKADTIVGGYTPDQVPSVSKNTIPESSLPIATANDATISSAAPGSSSADLAGTVPLEKGVASTSSGGVQDTSIKTPAQDPTTGGHTFSSAAPIATTAALAGSIPLVKKFIGTKSSDSVQDTSIKTPAQDPTTGGITASSAAPQSSTAALAAGVPLEKDRAAASNNTVQDSAKTPAQDATTGSHSFSSAAPIAATAGLAGSIPLVGKFLGSRSSGTVQDTSIKTPAQDPTTGGLTTSSAAPQSSTAALAAGVPLEKDRSTSDSAGFSAASNGVQDTSVKTPAQDPTTGGLTFSSAAPIATTAGLAGAVGLGLSRSKGTSSETAAPNTTAGSGASAGEPQFQDTSIHTPAFDPNTNYDPKYATVNSAAPTSSTAALAAGVPLEKNRATSSSERAVTDEVPSVVTASQKEAGYGTEASGVPSEVKEKGQVEEELLTKVPETPATSAGEGVAATTTSSGEATPAETKRTSHGGLFAGVSAAVAGIGAAAYAATSKSKEKTPETAESSTTATTSAAHTTHTTHESLHAAKEKFVEKGTPYYEKAVEKSTPYYEKAKEKSTPYYEKAVEKSTPYYEKAKEKSTPYYEKASAAASPYVEKAKEKGTPYYEKASAAASPYVEKAKEKSAPYYEKASVAAAPYVEKAKASPYYEKAAAKLHKDAPAGTAATTDGAVVTSDISTADGSFQPTGTSSSAAPAGGYATTTDSYAPGTATTTDTGAYSSAPVAASSNTYAAEPVSAPGVAAVNGKGTVSTSAPTTASGGTPVTATTGTPASEKKKKGFRAFVKKIVRKLDG